MLKPCPECHVEISSKATICPHCGYKPRRTSQFTIVVALLIVVIGIWVCKIAYRGFNQGYNDAINKSSQENDQTTQTTLKGSDKRAQWMAASYEDRVALCKAISRNIANGETHIYHDWKFYYDAIEAFYNERPNEVVSDEKMTNSQKINQIVDRMNEAEKTTIGEIAGLAAVQ